MLRSLVFPFVSSSRRSEFVVEIASLRLRQSGERSLPMQFGNSRRQIVFVLEDHRTVPTERVLDQTSANNQVWLVGQEIGFFVEVPWMKVRLSH